jgi:L-ribulose-5-phosphate 4-epimerase
MADEFGGPIPCGRYCEIGGEEIGQEIVRAIGASVAILIRNHGVFTVGATPTAATKAAVMVEDSARTVHLAMQLGQPEEISAEEVERGHQRYVDKYGQQP